MNPGERLRSFIPATLAGIAAGGIAAVPAALLNLPLRSPDDGIFNSATVTIGALMAGGTAGALWRLLQGCRHPVRTFVATWAAVFIAVVVLSVIGEGTLDRTVSFVVPLAALVMGLVAILTPTLANTMVARWWTAPAALVVALAVGIPLAGWGDAESGHLELPPVTAAQATATSIAVAATSPVPAAASPTVTPASSAPSTPAATPTAPPSAAATATPAARVVGQYEGVTFVVGQGSKATFAVQEKFPRFGTTTNAVLRTEALTGDVHLDGKASVITMDLHTLTSDQSQRDRYVRQEMFPNDPLAVFTLQDDRRPPVGIAKGQVVTGQVSGTLRLKGKDYPLSFDLEARDDGDVVYVLGRTMFTWSQLGLEAPTVVGFREMADQISVEVLIAARPVPSAAQG